MSSGEEPEVVAGLQVVVPEAAEGPLEPLLGSRLPQSVGAEPVVGQASLWAAGACLVSVAVGVVGAVHQEASVALGPVAGGPEHQGPYEVVKQEASVDAGWGEWSG